MERTDSLFGEFDSGIDVDSSPNASNANAPNVNAPGTPVEGIGIEEDTMKYGTDATPSIPDATLSSTQNYSM